MATGAIISLAGLAAGGLLVLWLFRVRVDEWRRRPIIPTNGSEVAKAFLTGVAVAVSIVVGALSLNGYKTERKARVDADVQSLSDRIRLNKDAILTRAQVREIARQVNKPTQADFVRFLERFNEQCSRSPRCKQLYTESVTKVLRVTPEGRIVPAPMGNPPARREPQAVRPRPPSRQPPPKVIVRPDPRVDGLARDLADARRDLERLQARKVDSGLLDGVDNRLTGVEGILGGLQSQVGEVAGRLGRLLDRLCRGLRLCL